MSRNASINQKTNYDSFVYSPIFSFSIDVAEVSEIAA